MEHYSIDNAVSNAKRLGLIGPNETQDELSVKAVAAGLTSIRELVAVTAHAVIAFAESMDWLTVMPCGRYELLIKTKDQGPYSFDNPIDVAIHVHDYLHPRVMCGIRKRAIVWSPERQRVLLKLAKEDLLRAESSAREREVALAAEQAETQRLTGMLIKAEEELSAEHARSRGHMIAYKRGIHELGDARKLLRESEVRAERLGHEVAGAQQRAATAEARVVQVEAEASGLAGKLKKAEEELSAERALARERAAADLERVKEAQAARTRLRESEDCAERLGHEVAGAQQRAATAEARVAQVEAEASGLAGKLKKAEEELSAERALARERAAADQGRVQEAQAAQMRAAAAKARAAQAEAKASGLAAELAKAEEELLHCAVADQERIKDVQEARRLLHEADDRAAASEARAAQAEAKASGLAAQLAKAEEELSAQRTLAREVVEVRDGVDVLRHCIKAYLVLPTRADAWRQAMEPVVEQAVLRVLAEPMDDVRCNAQYADYLSMKEIAKANAAVPSFQDELVDLARAYCRSREVEDAGWHQMAQLFSRVFTANGRQLTVGMKAGSNRTVQLIGHKHNLLFDGWPAAVPAMVKEVYSVWNGQRK